VATAGAVVCVGCWAGCESCVELLVPDLPEPELLVPELPETELPLPEPEAAPPECARADGAAAVPGVVAELA
jgi:hypothetical protein